MHRMPFSPIFNSSKSELCCLEPKRKTIGTISQDIIDSSCLSLRDQRLKAIFHLISDHLSFDIRPYFQLKLQNGQAFPPEGNPATPRGEVTPGQTRPSPCSTVAFNALSHLDHHLKETVNCYYSQFSIQLSKR